MLGLSQNGQGLRMAVAVEARTRWKQRVDEHTADAFFQRIFILRGGTYFCRCFSGVSGQAGYNARIARSTDCTVLKQT